MVTMRIPIATWPGQAGHLNIFEKIRSNKIGNIENKTKTNKFDQWNQCIGPSRYTVQLLELLEHPGYANTSVKKSAEPFCHGTRIYNGDPDSKLLEGAGVLQII